MRRFVLSWPHKRPPPRSRALSLACALARPPRYLHDWNLSVTNIKEASFKTGLLSGSAKAVVEVDDGWNVEFAPETIAWSSRSTANKMWVIFMIVFKICTILLSLYAFICSLSFLANGFRLVAGRQAGEIFKNSTIFNNPIAGMLVGVLVTVLVQSSSTSTSIVITMVAAELLTVKQAISLVMGANIGTSVTNTIVAMGHFNNPDDLRRGFAAATVHDCFNMLNVAVFLPLNWIYPFLEKMTYEMAKDQEPCDGEKCEKTEFLKPYISPYSKGVANYNKDVAKAITQNYCAGKCDTSISSSGMKLVSKEVCVEDADGNFDCSGVHANYESNWMSKGYLYKKRAPGYIVGTASGSLAEFHYDKPATGCSDAVDFFADDEYTSTVAGSLTTGTCYKVCAKVKKDCEKRLLKGGLTLDKWDMTDDGAGTFLTIISLISLCSCLFCIVYMLQIILKGTAARVLQKVVGLNGYLNIAIGTFITIMVQSSSITTSTLTPLAAVGIITLKDMFPLTLGANIGTTLTGIMGATVVTSNPVQAWQVALSHLFFNIFGTLLWYPIPKMREVPLKCARFLGKCTAHPEYGRLFPLVYISMAFFIIPGIAYGIASA